MRSFTYRSTFLYGMHFRQPESVTYISPAIGARNQLNQVVIGLSYQPASLCSLATQFQTRLLESIPRPIAGLKFLTQDSKLMPENFLSSQLVGISNRRLGRKASTLKYSLPSCLLNGRKAILKVRVADPDYFESCIRISDPH
jgi:hypothetical protein